MENTIGDRATAERDIRNLVKNCRGFLQDFEQTHHEDFMTSRRWQTTIDEVNSSLSNINVKKIEQLDTRPATYATDATRSAKLNDNTPYEYQHDTDGRLSRVDVDECVHTFDDFLAELRRGAFDKVYLTKPMKEQPSVVMKVLSPMQRYSSYH